MLSKLKSKLAAAKEVLVGGVHSWAITRLAAADQPWLTAQLVKPMLRRVYSVGAKANAAALDGERPCRVVLLWRPGFNEDAMEALKALGPVEAFTLSRGAPKAMAAAFIPRGVDDNNYASAAPAAHAGMVRYRVFLKKFWRAVDPHRRIDAVLTANFGYFAEQELAAALEELGVPFIALHKENSWTPSGQAFWEQVYRERRRRFGGRRILVYNPVERDVQIRGGIVTPDRIEVVGMPRLDAVHRWREANAGSTPEPNILFPTFLPQVGIPILPRKAHGREAERYFEALDENVRDLSVNELCLATHRAIVALAAANPDIKVWIKSKGHSRDQTEFHRLLGVQHERDLPGNLKVVHGGSPLELLYRSAVVCGFHTTVLLEALAAGRPVVVPWFAEALDPAVNQYLFDLAPAIVRASSPADLVDKLRTLAHARTPVPRVLKPVTMKVLHDWLGNDDGKAGERAAAAILRTIRAARSAV